MRWLVALAVVGCAKPATGPSELDVKLGIARAIVDAQLTDIRAAIEAERARAVKPAWTPEAYLDAEHSNNRGFFACAAASGALPTLRMVADPRVFVLAQLCDHDLPLAELTTALAIVEAAPGECMMVRAGRAEAFDHREGEFAALRARIDLRCKR